MAVEFTLEDVDPEAIDVGGIINQQGWFQTVVEDVYRNRKGDSSYVFELVCTAGAFKGAKQWFTLVDPESADKPEMAKQRQLTIGKRLGLLTKESVAAQKAAGEPVSITWEEAIGKECWLEMSAPKEGKCWPEYVGLYPLDHERVPVELRKSIGIKVEDSQASESKSTRAKAGKTGNGTAAKPPTNNDFSDL